jgi:phosphohistidine phosphatase
MEILILRHGEAGKRIAPSSHDADRQLTVAGKDEVTRVAQSMKEIGMKFDVIGTSPLKRARQTADVVGKVLGQKKTVEEWDELKPEGDRKLLYKRLARLRRDSSVLIVGHEPYLTKVIGDLITGGREASVVLKKAGLARLEISVFSPVPRAELRWLLTPRLAKKVA